MSRPGRSDPRRRRCRHDLPLRLCAGRREPRHIHRRPCRRHSPERRRSSHSQSVEGLISDFRHKARLHARAAGQGDPLPAVRLKALPFFRLTHRRKPGRCPAKSTRLPRGAFQQLNAKRYRSTPPRDCTPISLPAQGVGGPQPVTRCWRTNARNRGTITDIIASKMRMLIATNTHGHEGGHDKLQIGKGNGRMLLTRYSRRCCARVGSDP